jgi:hypothetical protein
MGIEAAAGDLEYRAAAVRPPLTVVPNRSPWASAIKVPCGVAPSVSLMLTRVVGVLA